MLLTTFLPEVDELPTSWMARLAVANGYTDIDDMLQSLGITSGTRRVTRHVDYFKLIIAQLPKSDWVTTCVTLYMNELREQRKLIPVLNEGRLGKEWWSGISLSAPVSWNIHMLEARMQSGSC